MRAKAIAAVLALGVALFVAPSEASAKPGFHKRPGYVATVGFLLGHGGSSVILAESHGETFLTASRPVGENGESTVSYARRVRSKPDGHVHLDLGPAGKVDLRFVSDDEEREPAPGCTGGPTTVRQGHLVGTISFHPPGGFVRVKAHRVRGLMTLVPPRVCRGRAARVDQGVEGRIRRLVSGERNGDRRFEATLFPTFGHGPSPVTIFRATATHKAGPLMISDSASTSTVGLDEPFRVPSLDALPATASVEPGAPFSGSATFAFPSRRTASLSGDLAVELPEVGEVPLTGPKIVAGLCRGLSCTRSLPKALRSGSSAGGFFVSDQVELQTIR